MSDSTSTKKKTMNLLDFLGKKAESVVRAAKWPLVRKAIVGSAQSIKTKYEIELCDLDSRLTDQRLNLVKAGSDETRQAILQAIINLRIEKTATQDRLDAIESELTEYDQPVELEEDEE